MSFVLGSRADEPRRSRSHVADGARPDHAGDLAARMGEGESVSANTAVAIAATSSSSSALIAARAAQERRECEAFVSSYKAQSATVEEMRVYANCVGRLHPAPVVDPAAITMLRIAIVFVVICGIVGAFVGLKDEHMYDGPISAIVWVFMSLLMGGTLGILAVAALSFIVYGIGLVVTQ